MITIILVLVGVAAVGYVLASRVRGQRLNVRRLLVLPGVLSVIGLIQVSGVAHRGVRATDALLLATGVVASALLGLARGATVTVFIRDGQAWLRYRAATLGLWGATIAVRVVVTGLAFATNATLTKSGPAFLLSIGVTLLCEGAVLARRAFATGADGWQARTRRQPASLR